MKIGLIVNSPSAHQVALLDALAGMDDIELLVVYAFAKNPARNWGVPVTQAEHAELPWKRGLSAFGSLKRWLKKFDCDVWILGSVITAARTHVVAKILSEMDSPLAFLGEPPRPRSGWRGQLRDSLLHSVLQRCDAVVATGKESARRYREILGDERPVANVPYYTALKESLRIPLPEEIGANEIVRFVTLAQLIERKGIDVLLAACRRLPVSGWRLDIFGDGPLRYTLQATIDRDALPITLHRSLSFIDRLSAFEGAHCFVFPTRWDGWGMSIPEALAAGKPVISTDQAMAAHEFIVEGEAGWIGPSESEEFFAGKMQLVIDQREILPKMSCCARASVADYRPEEGARRLMKFATELVALKKGGELP